MSITAEELLEIVKEVENIKDYDERQSEISEILYKLYNSQI